MSDDKGRDIFAWEENGSYGLGVKLDDRRGIAPEVMYEDDVIKIKERPLYLGLPVPRMRFDIALALIILTITGLITRAFWMQVKDHGMYMDLAERNRLRKEVMIPPRGIIRDVNGKILADNVPTFDIAVTPIDLPADEDARKDLLGKIARLAGVPMSELEEDVLKARYPDQKIVVARDIKYESAIAFKIEIADTPGASLITGQKRRYPFSAEYSSFSHILGYVGRISPDEIKDLEKEGYRQTDVIGKAGVEATYENLLRGQVGEKIIEVDSFGHEQRVVHETKPTPGKDLVLTIDAELQKKAEKALAAELEKNGIKKGSAILLDPRDGAIMAIASLPSYDNNIFSGQVSSTAYQAYLKDPNNPFLARAWAGLFPSGSSIKPVYAVALLAEKIITTRTTVVSRGGIRLGSIFFPDWAAGGHGVTDVKRAIAFSVNTFFYITCGGYDGFKGLGPEKMSEWLKKFGFGSKMGLDIPGEQGGLVPSPEWKMSKKNEKWYVGDSYNFSIGQGDFLVTPLQIAVATGQIANGGKTVVPHLAKENAIATERKAGEQLASKETVDIVRSGMRDTIRIGSGRSLSSLPFSSAGKTGTAQWGKDKPNHAWFTAFATYEDPAAVVTVLLEEGVEGSRTAVPVAKEILGAWYSTKHPN